MIQKTDKTKCSGCTACYSVCPKNCITMLPDPEGFLYPQVDASSCIECGACESVCPYHTPEKTGEEQSIYAAVQVKNEGERITSTAGGAFSLLADVVLDHGGIVYAVGYDEDMVVCHKPCSSTDALQELRGSKYVQSTLGQTFRDIKRQLKERTVLFVGTPCQVHGLKNYIGQVSNLYTIDLLCLGVSSPRLFAQWISYLNRKYGTKVTYVAFRNKHYGYSTPNVRVFFENGKEMDQKYDTRVHANLFFRHYNVRPSCYECEFREIPRVSDFTIGDFTDIGSVDRAMDDDKGTTKLWVHTPKGRELLAQAADGARMHYLYDHAPNVVGGPKKQIRRPERRGEFFQDAEAMDYGSLISKWEPRSLKGELAGILRPVINVLPFKTQFFQYLRKRKSRKFHRKVDALNFKRVQ